MEKFQGKVSSLYNRKEEPGDQEHVTIGNWHLRFHLCNGKRRSTDFTLVSFSSWGLDGVES